jgi:Family of unknown function (DUF6629)
MNAKNKGVPAMCFSASASFIASVYLAIIGALCVKKNNIKEATLFAAIPMLFAVQQASEGLLWLSLSHTWPYMQLLMPYIFLLFAFFLWPIWIPLSVIALEPRASRRRYLTILTLVGILVSLYLYGHVLIHGASASALDCHIYYQVVVPEAGTIVGMIAYLLVTAVPFFTSSLPVMWLFGIVLLLSYWFTYIFYYTYLISLWCFFAAILSGFVYVVIIQLNKR